MKTVCLIAIFAVFTLTATMFGCSHQQPETQRPNDSSRQSITIKEPLLLLEMGFEREILCSGEIIYHDAAKATGSVIIVTISQTPPEGIEKACQDARRSAVSLGYAIKTTESQFNEDRTICHFTKTGEITRVPISGKTVVRITPEHPELVVIISGLWGSKHQKLMSKTFDRFAEGVSIQAKPTE